MTPFELTFEMLEGYVLKLIWVFIYIWLILIKKYMKLKRMVIIQIKKYYFLPEF